MFAEVPKANGEERHPTMRLHLLRARAREEPEAALLALGQEPRW